MSNFDRFKSDRAEASIAQIIVGGMIFGGAFLGINAPGVSEMFNNSGMNSPQYPIEQPVEQPTDEEPIDVITEEETTPIDENEQTEPIEESIETEEPVESSLIPWGVSEAVFCSGDLSDKGISDFSLSFDAPLPPGSTVSVPTWLIEQSGSYTQSAGISEVGNDGNNTTFKVIDEGYPETYVSYFYPTSIEYVHKDFNETITITLPEGYEAGEDSTLVYEINVNSPYCEIETV